MLEKLALSLGLALMFAGHGLFLACDVHVKSSFFLIINNSVGLGFSGEIF